MARANRRIAQRAVHLLDVQPDDRVLEVGFGPGVAIELLARAPCLYVTLRSPDSVGTTKGLRLTGRPPPPTPF